MFINLCYATIGIPDSGLKSLIQLAKNHGFGGLDLPGEALQSEQNAEQAAQLVEEAGLQWGLFWLPTDFLQSDDASYQAGLQRLKQTAPLAARAGCRRAYNHIWPGSHDRAYDENFQWHIARLKPIVEVLGENGIRIGLEFIGPKTLRDSFRYPFIHTLPQTLELADAVDPTVGVALDCFHWYCSGGTLDEIRQLDARRVINVHANDAVYSRSREEQMDLERALPLSTGVVDAAGVLRALSENGYDGPVIAEPFSPTIDRFRQTAPDEVAKEVSDCMRQLFARATG
jgi:sugar phosphate isomerase/epimerase